MGSATFSKHKREAETILESITYYTDEFSIPTSREFTIHDSIDDLQNELRRILNICDDIIVRRDIKQDSVNILMFKEFFRRINLDPNNTTKITYDELLKKCSRQLTDDEVQCIIDEMHR